MEPKTFQKTMLVHSLPVHVPSITNNFCLSQVSHRTKTNTTDPSLRTFTSNKVTNITFVFCHWGSFTQKTRFGHRTGWSPCAHSIGKFFLWRIVLTILKLPPLACPALLIYIRIYVSVSFSKQQTWAITLGQVEERGPHFWRWWWCREIRVAMANSDMQ